MPSFRISDSFVSEGAVRSEEHVSDFAIQARLRVLVEWRIQFGRAFQVSRALAECALKAKQQVHELSTFYERHHRVK